MGSIRGLPKRQRTGNERGKAMKGERRPAQLIRYCTELGMLSIDRPLNSCAHCTNYCKAHCYNNKLDFGGNLQPSAPGEQAKESLWQDTLRLVSTLHSRLSRCKKQTRRIRLMTRGEAFARKCVKTWTHKKGHCSKCRAGCFESIRVDVWLKMY